MAIKFLSNESIDGTLEVGSFTVSGSGIVASVGMTLQVDAGSVNAITIDNVGTVTTSGYLKIPNYLFHDGNTDTFLQFGTDTITLRGDSGITLDGPVTANESISITGNLAINGLTNSDYDADADNLVLGATSGNAGITIRSGSSAGNYGSIYFADGTNATANKAGYIRYEQNTSKMTFGINAAEKLAIDLSGNVAIQPGGATLTNTRLYVVSADNYNPSLYDGMGGIRIGSGGSSSAGDGNYTGGIGFAITSGTSGIAGVQKGADADKQGLAFFTHPSDTGGDAAVEKMRLDADGNLGIGNPLAGETYPRELLDIRESSGTNYPKILVKYDNNTGTTTAPTANLLLSPGQFSSDETAPRIVGYRTADFSSAAARSAGLKFGVAQNNAAKDAVMITETSDIWQLNGANSTSAFAPWDVSYPDEGICINTPSGGTKYLSFADSQTPSYGGGMRYFEVSNFTEIYSKLDGAYTTHLRADRASPYTTWLNPDISGNTGNVGIGISTAPLAKLHLEGTSDMIRVVKNVDSYGPQIDLILNQTSPSNGDTAAYINMGAKDNSGNSKYWGSIRAVVDNIFTEIGGFEFYTRAASDFSKRLKISAQGKVIVYQKDNVSGFYLDGANTRLYANGGGGTDYRGIEVNSSGMWSWGETGSSNFFANKVGIGTSSPSYKCVISNSGNEGIELEPGYVSGANLIQNYNRANSQYVRADYVASIHRWYQGDTSNVNIHMDLTGSGTLTVKADLVAYGSPSDKRLKENIKPIESALDKVSKLQGVTFDWKESDSILNIKEDIGFIAQDVQKVIPELVRENDNGMLSMRHQGIAPILLEAIKELKAEIEGLKNKPCACNNCNCKE